MRKIPTVFQRDPENPRFVTNVLTGGCGWVFNGDGRATRKYDGTCMMLDDAGVWWARREVKDGGRWPSEFVQVERDPNTGKTMGWQPVRFSPFAKFHAEAAGREGARPGTYELVGPKINGNPEKLKRHELWSHGDWQYEMLGGLQTFESVREFVRDLGTKGVEGVVWHHPDGRMAKLKARDLP